MNIRATTDVLYDLISYQIIMVSNLAPELSRYKVHSCLNPN